MINIDNLIKNATLSHDKVALNAYKNIKAEFQKVQTAKNYKGEWTEQLELQTISKYAKSHHRLHHISATCRSKTTRWWCQRRNAVGREIPGARVQISSSPPICEKSAIRRIFIFDIILKIIFFLNQIILFIFFIIKFKKIFVE